MSEKNCTSCDESKLLSEFYKNKETDDGHLAQCITCVKSKQLSYRRSKNGLIAQIYSSQKKSSKSRNHPLPTYTQKELLNWVFRQSNFDELFNAWVKSGYFKNKTPSIDRLDDYKSYSFENIQLITWEENHKKANSDMKNGINNKQSKPVIQLTKTGNFVAKHHSGGQAARTTGGNQQNINSCCLGKLQTSGGYKWEYSNNVD